MVALARLLYARLSTYQATALMFLECSSPTRFDSAFIIFNSIADGSVEVYLLKTLNKKKTTSPSVDCSRRILLQKHAIKYILFGYKAEHIYGLNRKHMFSNAYTHEIIWNK